MHSYWDDSTAVGIRCYSRDHTALAPPASTQVDLRADPAFRGASDRLHPPVEVTTTAVTS